MGASRIRYGWRMTFSELKIEGFMDVIAFRAACKETAWKHKVLFPRDMETLGVIYYVSKDSEYADIYNIYWSDPLRYNKYGTAASIIIDKHYLRHMGESLGRLQKAHCIRRRASGKWYEVKLTSVAENILDELAEKFMRVWDAKSRLGQ